MYYTGTGYCWSCGDYREYETRMTWLYYNYEGHDIYIEGVKAYCKKCGREIKTEDLNWVNRSLAKAIYEKKYKKAI
jgi:YgiT-type zinc finger domain-containing protein